MTPAELYRSNLKAGTHIPNSFYENPEDKTPYDKLNDLRTLSPTEIWQYQRENILSQMELSPKMQEIAQILNNDVTSRIGNDKVPVEQIIKDIEQAISYTDNESPLKTIMSKDAKVNLEKTLEAFKLLEKRLSNVYNNIAKTKGVAIPGTQIAKELERIDVGLTAIKNSIASYDGSVASLYTPETSGFLKGASWLGLRLKGAYLEVAGTEWIDSKLPNNIKVVNVGKVTGPTVDILGNITGTGKMLRTDLMAFDLSKNITVEFNLGSGKNKQLKKMSLSDFVDFLDKTKGTESISFDENQFAELQKALVFGVQSKSGQNQAIFNPKSETLSNAIQLEGLESVYARQLDLLVKLIAINNNLSPTHDAYNSLFNYCISKGLANIVGKENSLVLTRAGVTTMRDYLINKWQTGKYFIQAKNRVNIKKPGANIAVHYASASDKK